MESVPNDINLYSCESKNCPDRGIAGKGNLRVHSRTGPGRINWIIACKSCGSRFSETRGELVWRAKLSEDLVYLLLDQIRAKAPIRAIARAHRLSRNTVRRYRDLFCRHKLI